MQKPDFFIVGAAKSGTTSMMRYLDQHPDIAIPQKREPLFFATDFDWPELKVTDLQHYLSIFADAKQCKYVGEKSVWHLYSANAAHEINAFNPDAKIIALLRNPIDMIYSLHGQLLRQLDEDITNFEEALAAVPDRESGSRLPQKTRSPEALWYTKVGQYSQQILRYIKIFGKDRVHVVIFDDFKKRPVECYKATLEFLGADPNFQPRLEIHNQATKLRSRSLQRILNEQPFYFRMLPSYIRLGLQWRLEKFNRQVTPNPPMRPESRAFLQGLFSQDIDNLSDILERDLSTWYQS